jgi:hypothetical protein
MGLLKRLLSRGLSGADSPEPWNEPPESSLVEWPPGPPPIVAAEPEFGIETWRHPVSLDRKELWESGFDFSGPKITAAFASNSQEIQLTADAGNLLVNDVKILNEQDAPDYLEITHTPSEAQIHIATPTWALAVALHDAYLEPLDPERSWQLGQIDETTVLFLARPGEIAAIARRSEMQLVADLSDLQPK